MKLKTLAALTLPLAGFGLLAAAPGFTQPDVPKRMKQSSPKVVAAAPASNAMAWAVRDRGDIPLGLVSFNLNAPENLTSMFALPDKAYAGVNTPEGYFFYRFREDTANETMEPLAWSKVDPLTGQITDIASWKDKYYIFNDMACDYSTGDIYAIAREIYTDDFLTALTFEYSALYKVSGTTGVATRVKQFINWENGAMGNPTYITMTADIDGNLYVIDISGNLLRLDPENDYAETLIGRTGRTPASRLQTMDYDPVSRRIFWAADYSTALADLCMIDPATGKTEVVGLLGTDSRMAGLTVPFAYPATGAPAGVSALTATPDATGGNSVKISFTAPSKTYGKTNLASISGITLSRGGEQVNAWASVTPGSALDFTDNVAAPGSYTYTVTPKNVLGAGLPQSVTCWVGHDVPDSPANVGIGRNDDGSALIVWEAPEQGKHGGWIDRQNLTYKVVRMPGGTLVGKDLTDTEFTDRTITTMSKYSYMIYAVTPDGESDPASSIEIALGSQIALFPYNCCFEDISVFNTWSVLNPNGGESWEWKHRGMKDYDAFAMYKYDNKNDADDYLVSPPIQLKAGSTYSLKFNYRGSNANYTETFDVRFGNAPTVEGLTNVLKSYSVKTGDGAFSTLDLPAVETDGIYYIAFHATSPKGQYNLYITDVTIARTSGEDPGITDTFVAPTALQATADAGSGDVTLSWSHSEGGQVTPSEDPETGISTPIFDDWETYPNWEINPTGKYKWKYIDGDGGIPYKSDYYDMPYPTDGKPLAAMIMAPYELTREIYGPNPPFSGDKYLLFKSNFSAGDGTRPAPVPDDYLISPKLNFSSDFVFSFMCKADPDLEAADGGMWTSRWNKESFRVGYSTTGSDPADFIWLTDQPETVTSVDDSWKKREYAIPAAARHVCINYCTPENGYWFMVDDIYIGAPAATPARRADAAPADAPTFKNFDVYVDGAKVASTPATSHVVKGLAEGHHTARVVAVYAEGESEPAEIDFLVRLSGIAPVGADADISVSLNQAARAVRFSSPVDKAELFDINGRSAASATNTEGISIAPCPAGIYILRLEQAGRQRTVRIIVK